MRTAGKSLPSLPLCVKEPLTAAGAAVGVGVVPPPAGGAAEPARGAPSLLSLFALLFWSASSLTALEVPSFFCALAAFDPGLSHRSCQPVHLQEFFLMEQSTLCAGVALGASLTAVLLWRRPVVLA